MTNNLARPVTVTDKTAIQNLYGCPFYWIGSSCSDTAQQIVDICNEHDIVFKNNTATVSVVSGKDLKKAFNKRKTSRFPVDNDDIFYILDWNDFEQNESEKLWKNGKVLRYLDDLIDSI